MSECSIATAFLERFKKSVIPFLIIFYYCIILFQQDKPWVFAHLLQLQRRLGKDAFPLVEQTYFPNPKDMVSTEPIILFFEAYQTFVQMIYVHICEDQSM